MPPKNSGASKKTEQKEMKKVIEDKTFGLKNKNKSKTVQNYVKSVANKVQNVIGKGGEQYLQSLEYQKKQDQKKEEEKNNFLASLLKSVTTINQTEAKSGEDPKSILCAYFKAGVCKNGKKCKYSHDLDVENKTAKIDLYTDQREGKVENDMNSWDNATLQKAVEENQRKYKNQKPTEIICKYFLEAVENKKYGWFWVCSSGVGCMYRHCLPPGYVLKRDIPKDDKEQELAIEEIVEEERARLTSKSTPVTLERFKEWKEKKRLEREALEKKKVEDAKKQSKGLNQLSGRALFKFDPTLFADDDDAVDDVDYNEREEEQDEEEEVDRKYNLEDQIEEEEEQKEEEELKEEEYPNEDKNEERDEESNEGRNEERNAESNDEEPKNHLDIEEWEKVDIDDQKEYNFGLIKIEAPSNSQIKIEAPSDSQIKIEAPSDAQNKILEANNVVAKEEEKGKPANDKY